MTQVRQIPPRPKNLDDVHARLVSIESDVAVVREVVQSIGGQVGDLMARAINEDTAGVPRPPRAPFRDPESSYHDFDPDLAEYRRALKARIKDPSRFDSERARAQIHKAIQEIGRDSKAARWDGLVKIGTRILIAIIVAYAVGLTYAHFHVPN